MNERLTVGDIDIGETVREPVGVLVVFEEGLTDVPNDILCVTFADCVLVRDGVGPGERVLVTFGDGPEPTLVVLVAVILGELFVGEELLVIVLDIVPLGLLRLAEAERLCVAGGGGI